MKVWLKPGIRWVEPQMEALQCYGPEDLVFVHVHKRMLQRSVNTRRPHGSKLGKANVQHS